MRIVLGSGKKALQARNYYGMKSFIAIECIFSMTAMRIPFSPGFVHGACSGYHELEAAREGEGVAAGLGAAAGRKSSFSFSLSFFFPKLFPWRISQGSARGKILLDNEVG